MSSVQDEEVEVVLGIMRNYGRPINASGVLLGTAVVTDSNWARLRYVMAEMEQRGVIRVRHAPRRPDDEPIYELAEVPQS